ncbi:gp58-like family protein [Oceanobacillus profundus]|uniref:phage tail spike protein n=1 Tax=Oceanobacillus profundus TaxID=372463 RepID=UPI00204067B6|nr:phage tail spike protein [Oceanobacillus profundus]MCM3396778.1 gp58-like family protein [Oceanobacillus profundus]
MYPVLYKSDETNFVHNGLGLLTGAVSAIAIEELNGMFELNMQYDNDGFLASVIEEEMIIKAKANDKQGEQLFRIYSITKNHENDNLIIDAQHITYDLANNFVEQLVARNLTKRQVMELIGASTSYPHPFNVTSTNSTTQSSTSLYRTNPLQMIAGMEGSVLQFWGGQIERDNFNLVMHNRRGSDDGTLVTYKKNLTGLTAKFDISNLVTRIFPYIFKEATNDEPEKLITVPGKYIDSPHINDYEMPYILPVDFSNEEGVETRQDLLTVASKWFTETGRDKPKVEMEVQFEHLWETEEYKDVAALELVGMGDTITVEHGKLNVEGNAIVNRIEYDVIAEKNQAVDVGSVKAKFTDKVNKASDVANKVSEIEQTANQAIRAANGKNTNYHGPDEPIGNFNIGDLWFEEVDGEYTRTYRFDGIQWQPIVSADIKDIEEVANDARNKADQAVVNANLASSNALEAIDQSQTAFDEAQSAITVADAAKLASEGAERVASEAAELSTTAKQNAEKAITDAQSALSGIDSLQTSVSVELQNINGELSRKVSQSVFDGLQGTVSNQSTLIQQNAEAITQKAEKTYVDTVNETVDSHSTLISQNAEAIKYKASQSSVNTLTGQVEAHTAELQVQAQEIKSKMNSIDANAKFATQSQLTQTSSSLSSEIASVQGNLDGLEIGGRNLIRNSGEKINTTSYRIVNYPLTEDIPEGTVMTILLKGQLGEGKSRFGIYNTNGNSEMTRLLPEDRNEDGIYIKTFNWKLLQGNNSSVVVYHIPNTVTTASEIEWVKLVRGNKASLDWQPAPEDIQSQFSSINQTVDSISTRLGNSEGNISSLQQTSSSFATRIGNAEGNISSLTQTAQGLQTQVSNKADKSTVTQLAGVVDTKITKGQADGWYASQSQLTQTASSLQSTITSVRNDLDGLEIGGSNLAPIASFLSWSNGGYVRDGYTIRITGPSSGMSIHQDYYEPNTEYVFSFKFRKISGTIKDVSGHSNVAVSSSIKAYRDGVFIRDGWSTGDNDFPNDNKVYHYAVKFKTASIIGTTSDRIYIQPNRANGYRNNYVAEIWDIQLEKGTIVTDWSPAPEDLATQSQFSQLSDNINLRVMKDDVINQINVSTEGILISGKKLILDGDTTLRGTFRVDTANITSVNAGKITAGTFDAGRVSVINLSANSITGGILQSQNSNTTFNLNTGNLTMRNANLTIANGATINFEDPSNKITYRKYDSTDGYSRAAGIGVGDRIGGRYSFVYMGTNGKSELDTLDEYFTGLIINTSAAIWNDGANNSIAGPDFQFRDKAVNWNDAINVDFRSTPTISPMRNSAYNIGTQGLRFNRAYVNEIRGSGNVQIRDAYGLGGWQITTDWSSGENLYIGGLNTGSYNYNIGRSTNYLTYAYVNSVHANYLRGELQGSSARKFKKNEGKMDLQDSLEFIRNAEIVTFDWIRDEQLKINRDNPQTIYDRQVGFILDDLEMQNDYLIKSDEVTIKKDNIIFMHQQVIQNNLKRLDSHEKELMALRKQNEELILKVAKLEERINHLEVA